MHCISVYLTNKEGIRNSKLSHIIDSESLNKDWIELDDSIFASIEKPKDLDKYSIVAHVTTDYFGGFGEQTSTIYRNGVEEEYSNDYDAINQALRKLGVSRKNGNDEFDVVGLGKYRSNEDFQK